MTEPSRESLERARELTSENLFGAESPKVRLIRTANLRRKVALALDAAREKGRDAATEQFHLLLDERLRLEEKK